VKNYEHDIGLCRALYADARAKGSPVVATIRCFGAIFAETKDGKIKVESARPQCCLFATKYDIASQWLEKFGNTQPLGEEGR